MIQDASVPRKFGGLHIDYIFGKRKLQIFFVGLFNFSNSQNLYYHSLITLHLLRIEIKTIFDLRFQLLLIETIAPSITGCRNSSAIHRLKEGLLIQPIIFIAQQDHRIKLIPTLVDPILFLVGDNGLPVYALHRNELTQTAEFLLPTEVIPDVVIVDRGRLPLLR